MSLDTGLYLGIDCGTQGTKALLIDAEGRAHGRGYAKHTLVERSSGAREQEPQWWIDALRTAAKQALSKAQESAVLAIGVSGQQHGLVVLDEQHRVIRPAKLWNDTETAAQNADLIERFGGKQAFHERFGIVPMTGYTVSKLLWLRENEPENFLRIRHILLPHDYLNFWLTGRMCAEYGDASGTGFFDVRTRSWAREVLDEIDGGSGQLFHALPELLEPSQIAGNLRDEVAKELGIATTCLVSAGGGDNMMGAIGTGNLREGVVTLSLGTSSTVYSFRNSPSHDVTGNVAPFCSSTGGWLPLVCTMNATNVVTQTLEVMGKTVEDIESALTATTPGADGLVFVPFLNGERTPDLPHARGSLVGMSNTNFTANNVVRAVVEGVSFGILGGMELVLGAEKPERIVLIGGGARSSGWRQLLADATGAVIQLPQEEEAGCLGAAIQAIYAYRCNAGISADLPTIADRCVLLDESKTATPNAEQYPEYRHAMAGYRAAVAALYNE